MSIWKSLLSAIGSHSSDIPGFDTVENPLRPCPDSPNCLRITKVIEAPVDSVFKASIETLKTMKAERINISKSNYKIDTVFKVFFFRDDMSVQLSKRNSNATYLHIRSASREGYSDLGVNARRVKKFLNRLKSKL